MNYTEKKQEQIQAFVGGLYLICAWIKDYLDHGTEIQDCAYDLLGKIIAFEDMVQEHATGDSGRNFHPFRSIYRREATRQDLELALEESASFAESLLFDIDYVISNEQQIEMDNHFAEKEKIEKEKENKKDVA